jgi:hypothetical protein
MNSNSVLMSTEVFVIRGTSRDGLVRFYSIDQLGAPLWVDDIGNAMEFNTHGDAEVYVVENIIECPVYESDVDGGFTLKCPGILGKEMNPLSVEIQRTVTTVDIVESETIALVKASFKEVMDEVYAAIVPFRDMINGTDVNEN